MCRKGVLVIFLLLGSLFSFGQNNKPKPAAKSSAYIMHVVKFGETLTKISQKYGVSKTDILKANPSLTPDNLNPEQILRIPNIGNKKTLTTSNTTDSELKSKVQVSQELVPKTGKYHVVEKGQTMYAISKMYGVKVEDIQKWNNLTDFNVKVGSLLLVADPSLKASPKTNTEIKAIKDAPENTLTPKKTENTVQKEQLPKSLTPSQEDNDDTDIESAEKPDIQATDNESQKELAKMFKDKASAGNVQTTKGTGAPMTTTLGAMENVYFAMHKTLPIGTIIKIKNLVNSKIVYAKVIGKLPETDENKHVIVRYSLGVKKDLQLQNGKCYLQVEYPN